VGTKDASLLPRRYSQAMPQLRTMHGRSLIVACAFLVAIAGTWAFITREDSSPAVSGDPQLAAGEAIYKQHCAQCHGARLEGQPNWRQRLPSGRLPAPPHDASGHTWHHSEEQLFQIVKEGPAGIVPNYESDMPAYKDVLTDEQIREVLRYIESRWPEEIRAERRRHFERRG